MATRTITSSVQLEPQEMSEIESEINDMDKMETPEQAPPLRANAVSAYVAYVIGILTASVSWLVLLETLPGRDPVYLSMAIAILLGGTVAIAIRRLLLGYAR